jgi:hypothetical protein
LIVQGTKFNLSKEKLGAKEKGWMRERMMNIWLKQKHFIKRPYRTEYGFYY